MKKETHKIWKCRNCGQEMCCSDPTPEEAIVDEDGNEVDEEEEDGNI